MSLSHYPRWLGEVNACLARLTHHLFNAQDFDYPWIEAFLTDHQPEQAAQAAQAADAFPIKKLSTILMKRSHE